MLVLRRWSGEPSSLAGSWRREARLWHCCGSAAGHTPAHAPPAPASSSLKAFANLLSTIPLTKDHHIQLGNQLHGLTWADAPSQASPF